MPEDGLRWPPRTAAFNPLDPGDAEICWLFDQWKDAVSMGLWGQAAEYRQMYLQILKRRDIVKEQAARPLRQGYAATPGMSCTRHGQQLEPGWYPPGEPLRHRDGTECGPHDAPRPAG